MKNCRFLIICICLFYGNTLCAQERILKGSVILGEQSSVRLYSLRVQPVDTAFMIIEASFSDAPFEISCNVEGLVVVTISSLGYEDHVETLSMDDELFYDLGTINLIEQSILLKDATVTANRMQIERKGENIILKNIAASPLSEAGNLIDMLKRTPGVVVKGENDIAVIGRGSSLIYIDDRQVRNKEELLSLRSEDVRSIEIIRKPSARYSASTQSVIHIRTKSLLKDQLGLMLENYTDFRRKVSNNTSINVNVKKGIFSGNTSYRYGAGSTKSYEYSQQIITRSIQRIENNSEGYSGGDSNSHNVFAGINLNISPKHLLGVQYSGSYRDAERYTAHNQRIDTDNNILNKFNHSNEDSKNNLHSASINYMLKRNENSSLLFIGDYASRQKTDSKYMLETYLDENNRTSFTDINTKSEFDVYTLSGQYTFNLFGDIKNSAGVNYGYIKNVGNTEINNHSNPINIPQITTMKNSYLSIYYTFRKEWEMLEAYLGLRYEFDHNHVAETGGQLYDDKYKYSDFFPSIDLTYLITDDIDLSLSYRKRISRPSYYDLNPTIYYKDSLNYYTGNPSLKPTLFNEISLSSNIYDLNATVSYEHQKNTIVWVDTPESETSNIIVSKPINVDKSYNIMFSIDYSYSKKWFDGSIFAQLTVPHLEYLYLNESRIDDKPFWEFSINTNYTILKKIRLYANLYYQSPNDIELTHSGSILSLDIGVSAKFFKDRLYTSISGNDITGGSSNNWWESYYYNSYSWQKNKYDMRGVRLTLRYTFNTIKSGFRNRSGNRDVLYRL